MGNPITSKAPFVTGNENISGAGIDSDVGVV
jgi:hypothetical protein